jgi:hypothetical protein
MTFMVMESNRGGIVAPAGQNNDRNTRTPRN